MQVRSLTPVFFTAKYKSPGFMFQASKDIWTPKLFAACKICNSCSFFMFGPNLKDLLLQTLFPIEKKNVWTKKTIQVSAQNNFGGIVLIV